tara:strand:- start:203 stop:397 length:195 start_codon:yes stop_codon:yes gene_type:complete
MLEVIITYVDRKAPVDTFSILTYLRGEGYWQLLTVEGNTISIPDHAIQKMEVHPLHNSRDGESE